MFKNTQTTDPYKIRQEHIKNFQDDIANAQRIEEDMELTIMFVLIYNSFLIF